MVSGRSLGVSVAKTRGEIKEESRRERPGEPVEPVRSARQEAFFLERLKQANRVIEADVEQARRLRPGEPQARHRDELVPEPEGILIDGCAESNHGQRTIGTP